jgi:hypothetical protein
MCTPSLTTRMSPVITPVTSEPRSSPIITPKSSPVITPIIYHVLSPMQKSTFKTIIRNSSNSFIPISDIK